MRGQAVRELGIDGATIVGISVFDVLYNTAKLNPHALKGMAHLHQAKEFENLGDLMTFMKSEIIKSKPGEGAWKQMIHKYKGYTGEEATFDHLSASDNTIDIPTSGTAEGLDVTVDGKAFNVKVTDNPRYVQDHLDKHPDIDVITNHEMGSAFEGNPRVLIDADLSSQEAFHSTAETFEGMADLGDLIDSVPLITLAINSVRNGHRMYKGEIGLLTAAEHTAIDTAAVGGGGAIGAKAGVAVGVALAPLTGGISAIIIPTAATLVGGLMGVFAGKGISGWVKARHVRAAVKCLEEAAAQLRSEFLRLYSTVVGVSDAFFEVRVELSQERVEEEGLFRRVLFPSTETVFFNMAARKLRREWEESRRFYLELRRAVREASPSDGGMILYAQDENVLNDVEPLLSLRSDVAACVQVVEEERRKL